MLPFTIAENATPAAANKAKEPKVSHATVNADGADKETNKDNNRGGRPARERHGEKTARAARAPEGEGEQRRPKREFDRRSATGRGREVSRGGRGAFGAGNPAQDALEAEKNPQAAAEGAVDGVADAVEEEAVVEDVTPAEPEPVTFTLDEYLQKREEARQKLASVAPTAARTVNKETEFAGMTTLAVALDDYVSSGNTKAEAGRKEQRSTGKTQVLNVGFKFPTVQPEREREPRTGGRGGDREGGRGGRREGGAGRGAGRGDRGGRGAPRAAGASRPAGGAAAFNPADFPSL